MNCTPFLFFRFKLNYIRIVFCFRSPDMLTDRFARSLIPGQHCRVAAPDRVAVFRFCRGFQRRRHLRQFLRAEHPG